MYILERIKKIDRFFGKVGLTVGNFEGFHRGHREIIRTLVSSSRSRGLSAAAVTFKEHPLKELHGIEPERLTLPHEKVVNLCDAGIDLLFYLDFSSELAGTKPGDFLELLQNQLAPKLLCLGKGFRFGRNNRGDIEYLKSHANRFDYELQVVEDVVHDGFPVSSTRIRDAVKRGNFELARAMLDRPYHLYVTGVPERSLLQPLCTNCASPESGRYTCVLHCVNRDSHVEVRVGRTVDGFRIETGPQPEKECLYKLSFLGSAV